MWYSLWSFWHPCSMQTDLFTCKSFELVILLIFFSAWRKEKTFSVPNISHMFTFLEKSTMKWIWIKQLSRITLLQMWTSWLQRGHASKGGKKQAERFDACRGCKIQIQCERRFVKSRATVEGRSWIAVYKHCDPIKQLLTHWTQTLFFLFA